MNYHPTPFLFVVLFFTHIYCLLKLTQYQIELSHYWLHLFDIHTQLLLVHRFFRANFRWSYVVRSILEVAAMIALHICRKFPVLLIVTLVCLQTDCNGVFQSSWFWFWFKILWTVTLEQLKLSLFYAYFNQTVSDNSNLIQSNCLPDLRRILDV